MTWFWLNIPLAALIFLAVSGIPLWMVLRYGETGPTMDRPEAAFRSPRSRAPQLQAAQPKGARRADGDGDVSRFCLPGLGGPGACEAR